MCVRCFGSHTINTITRAAHSYAAIAALREFRDMLQLHKWEFVRKPPWVLWECRRPDVAARVLADFDRAQAAGLEQDMLETDKSLCFRHTDRKGTPTCVWDFFRGNQTW